MDDFTNNWSGGFAEWTEGDTAYLSVAFTWRLDEAYSKAVFYKQQGFKVRVGGPGVFTQKTYLAEVAEIGGDYPDAVVKHNPSATFASRGCPVGCWFCIVPAMEGKNFTLIDDFIVRPVLCDNNLSALPADFQNHIISRYIKEDVPLLDANSGFEPRTFDEDVYNRWKVINKGPWRFAYDDEGDGPFVKDVMVMLKDVPQSRKRVYVLIGNEPFDVCMDRIQRVIDWGGDPHVQPLMKLNALRKTPWVQHDWSAQLLKDVARWCNAWVWRKATFAEYSRTAKTPKYNKDQVNFYFNKGY
tara:strand:- start:132 stop:1028 length:897 start_codon:yes stop_codon:yes gene_type:complete